MERINRGIGLSYGNLSNWTKDKTKCAYFLRLFGYANIFESGWMTTKKDKT